jgi:parallel beta-helix repeat protein
MKRLVLGILLTLLLTSMLTLAFNVRRVKAEGTIYIRADGSIDPSTAPIERDENSYTLTDDIYSSFDGIVIERNNITLDGAGYTLQGTEAYYSRGISVFSISNVTVINTNIKGFSWGLFVDGSLSITVSGNNITNNGCGIRLESSSNSWLAGNNITDNGEGIYVFSSDNNSVVGNNVTSNRDVGIALSSSSSSNNNVFNNIVSNGRYGISCVSSNNSLVGNNLTENEIGVYLWSAFNNSIISNSIVGNDTSRVGMYIQRSTNNSIIHNNVTSITGRVRTRAVGTGILLFDSNSNNILRSNSMANNSFNFGVEDDYGYDLLGFMNDVDVSNTVDGKPIYYWVSEQDMTVPLDAGYVALVNCTRITVQNLSLTENREGVVLAFTTNSTITQNNITNNGKGSILFSSNDTTISGNNITNNWDGVWLVSSEDNTSSSSDNGVTGNNITANRDYGICLSFSSNNSASGNTVANNGIGVGLEYASPNNTIWHNNFMNNTSQVYCSEDSTSIWDDGYPSGGNYWSDYTGTDLYRGSHQNETSSDGIGDTPYTVDSNNRDNYPLMKPYPWNPHDIGVTYVGTVLEIYFPIIILIFPPKTIIGLGFTWNTSVFVMNYGANPEVFNVTVYANTAAISTVTNVALASRDSIILNFTWDTIGLARGNYAINAYATPVPGETDITDNNLTIGWVTVTIPGDVNGDYWIDMADISMIIEWFMRTPPNWNPNCDVNNDLTIDMADISIAIDNFMHT